MKRSLIERCCRAMMKAVGKQIKRMETPWMARRNPANRLFLTDYLYTHPLYPETLPPVTVTFVSDIHAGPLFSRAQEEQLKKGLSLLPSDLLLFGGDFGDAPEDGLRFISGFPLPEYPLGVYTVFGNHDLDKPEYRPLLTRAIRERGWTLLENSGCPVNGGLYLCGMDDLTEGSPDLEKTLAGTPGEGLCVLAAHNPDVLATFGASSFQLALCGHTHGGQVTIKGHSIMSSSIYRDRYRSGWVFEEGRDILVTNGVGTSLLPIRAGTDPQLIRLRIAHGRQEHRLLGHTRIDGADNAGLESGK